MSPKDIETVLKFYMSRLPEADLAELDALMTGGDPDDAAMAGDSAVQRRAFLALDARARVAVRKHMATRHQGNPEARAEFDAMFPHANRLG